MKMEIQDTRCGIYHIKPSFLQPCANIACFAAVSSMGFLLTSTLTFYIDSQLTTLERQFGFSSSQTGLLAAANDIGFLVFVLFASYMASIVHIPRSLGASVFLFGISAVMCSLPHFIFGPRQSKDLLLVTSNATSVEKLSTRNIFRDNLCSTRNYSVQSCDTKGGQKSQQEFTSSEQATAVSFIIIFMGMFLQGFAKAPRQSLGVSYIEHNAAKVNRIFIAGILMTASLFGPTIAFSLGGAFSKVYVTLEATSLNPKHPKWIGAWWLGFLILGCSALLTSLPLFWFPRRLPYRGANKRNVNVKDTLSPGDNTNLVNLRSFDVREKSNNERLHKPGQQNSQTEHSVKGKLMDVVAHTKEFLKTLLRLWKNPVLMATIFSDSSIIFAVAALKSYGGKYLELMFNVTVFKANFILSMQGLTAGITGTFLGGYLTKRLKMSPKRALQFSMVTLSLAVVCSVLAFFPTCEQPTVHNWPSSPEACNKGCNCKDDSYSAICGEDGKTYYSPCFAGCLRTENEVYQNCSCIPGGTARSGSCEYGCSLVYMYSFVGALRIFMATITIMPRFLVYVRCVSEKDVSTAIGFQAFMSSLLGWLLSPVLTGLVIDGVCTVWDATCGVTGRCLLYDNNLLRLKLHGYGAVATGLSLLFCVLAYVCGVWRRVKNFDTIPDDKDKNSVAEM